MANHTVILLVTGATGAGKSYLRCARFMADEWLADADNGVHFSNFPVNVEAMAEFVSDQTGQAEESVKERIHLIPSEVLSSWEHGDSGPWDYFKEIPIDGCHIAIDEVHVYCGVDRPVKIREQWNKWLADIRHSGATVELLSQDPAFIDQKIVKRAAVRLSLTSAETRRDPLFRIPFGDWYELLAKVRGTYRQAVWQQEEQRLNGKWIAQDLRFWWVDPKYFELYDSFNKTRNEGKEGTGKVREFQRRSALGLLAWFCWRHWFPLGWRLGFAGFVVYMCFFGGVRAAVHRFSEGIKSTTRKGASAVVAPGGEASEGGSSKAVKSAASRPGAAGPDACEELRLELATVKQEAAAAKVRIEVLEGEIDRGSAVVAIRPDRVTFRAGYSYKVGEVVDYGRYTGKRIVELDYEKRIVRLDDGTLLRMGVARLQSDSPSGVGSDLSGRLSEASAKAARALTK
jgi:hypothetical protein